MGLNIDEMLFAEALALAKDAQDMKVKDFVDLAQKEQLRESDWSYFWKQVNINLV